MQILQLYFFIARPAARPDPICRSPALRHASARIVRVPVLPHRRIWILRARFQYTQSRAQTRRSGCYIPKMNLAFQPLEGRFVRLEPFAPELKDEVRAAVDCDPETWAIMPANPAGDRFEEYWSAACGAALSERMPYAVRRLSDQRIVGMSSYYTALAGQGGVEIGSSFLHPDVRGGVVNPEAKFLMLDHAFVSGAVRVQFRVDTRNQRSQAAVAKLGAVKEGILRRDRITWTGYIRDTVYFSILDHEWAAVKLRLQQRLTTFQ